MKITLILAGLIASLTFFSNQAFSEKLKNVESPVGDIEASAANNVESLPEKKVAIDSPPVTDEDVLMAAQWIAEADKVAEAKKELDKKNESEIPVLATVKTDKSIAKPASTSRILWSLGLVLAVLFGFSVFLKRFLKKSPLKKNSQIKILTQHYLGPKKSLAIIRVAGESMLIGVTEQNINLIKSLALLDEEIPQDTPNTFSQSLGNSMAEGEQETDEFSISKIKDFVSDRLKNMKEI